jgi:hypothetical protein
VAASVWSTVVVWIPAAGDRVVDKVTPRVGAGSFRPRTIDGTEPRDSSVAAARPWSHRQLSDQLLDVDVHPSGAFTIASTVSAVMSPRTASRWAPAVMPER